MSNRLPLVEFSYADAAELTHFDREMFNGFYRVDDYYYNQLFDDGAQVIGHRNQTGDIVSVASLFLQSIHDPSAPQLEQHLPSWAAFLDGAAVKPAYRRQLYDQNLHAELITERVRITREYGKVAALAVVRQNNLASQRNLYKQGFFMAEDAEGFYGSRPEDDRVVGVNPLAYPNMYYGDISEPIPRDHVEQAMKWGAKVISLSVNRHYDTDYNVTVKGLLDRGWLGYSCVDDPSATDDSERACVMSLAHQDAFPEMQEPAVYQQMTQIRAELRELLVK
jgi:ribosomal protein S18 acetylase RimI-like enzyme